jgi:HNH endonuclease
MFKRYVYFEGLTSLFGSDNKVLISNRGQIRDLYGDEIKIEIDDGGHLLVNCQAWDGLKNYRVIDLVALQFKGLTIPVNLYSEVNAFVIDGDKKNTHASNIGYRFRHSLLPHPNDARFFYVPGMPGIAISRDGQIVNSKNLSTYATYVIPGNEKINSRGGYVAVRGGFTQGVTKIYLRHRALCLAFKEFPDHVDQMVVNHINGIPGDDRLENLEWVTKGDNNLHAYVNDLKNQHDRVLVRNILTNEVTEYYSVSECARKLGYATDETIRQRLKASVFGQVFQDGTQIKYKADPRDWVYIADPEKAVRENQQRLPCIVRCCKTLTVTEFGSVTDAAKHTGVLRSTIEYRLKKSDKSLLSGWQFKYVNDSEEFPNFTEQDYFLSLEDKQKMVRARNLLTGEEMEFDSIRSAGRYFDIYLSNLLLSNPQPLLPNGWQFRLDGETWIDNGDYDEVEYKSQYTVTAREESTGKIVIADRSSKMCEILGWIGSEDRKLVRRAALTRGNLIAKGYRFRLGVSVQPWPETQIFENKRSYTYRKTLVTS